MAHVFDPATLVDDHGDYLYRFASRYFRERSIAEDLVQDTFLAAVKNAASFKGESSVKTWLVSILRFKIVDQLRSRYRDSPPRPIEQERAERDADAGGFFDLQTGPDGHWRDGRGPSNWSDDPEQVVGQQEFLRELERCLQALPERVRQVFLLREIDERPIPEISASLKLSDGNTRVILHRARLLLRDCLDISWFQAERT